MVFPVSSTLLDSADTGLLQRRVANVARVLALIGSAFVVMRVVSVLAVDRPGYLFSTSMVAHYGGVAAAILMWFVCWRGTWTATQVYAIELVGLAAVCSLYAVMATRIPQAFRPEMTLVLAFGTFLLAHAVHVPSSWRWTALLAVVLALPLTLGAWAILNPLDPRLVAASASAAGSVQRSARSIIAIGMASVLTWWLVIGATAATASSVIYGLRREVREAQQLGQYTLERKLGEGGMAVVYLANHVMLRRPTAVKIFLPERVGEMGLSRFEREVRFTARLAHPNTVTIFDYGRTSDGLFYYAMELLDGASLAQIVKLSGPMPPGRVIHIMHQVAGALSEAHGLGLIHRDIKPANVMLTQQGGASDVAKVVDFGLVKEVEDGSDPNKTAESAIVGTPQFLAPEVILKHGEDGPARDLYALGCVGYYLLTGQHAFAGETLVEVCLEHVQTQPERPSRRLGASLPEDLETIVLELLAKSPASRPPSASALCRRLESCTSFTSWSQSDAHRWWEQYRPKLDEAQRAGPTSATIDAPALAVDMRGRRAAKYAISPRLPNG